MPYAGTGRNRPARPTPDRTYREQFDCCWEFPLPSWQNSTQQRFGRAMPADQRTEFTRLRERAGLSLEQAARAIAVSPRTAYRYEDGSSQPKPPVLWLLDRMG